MACSCLCDSGFQVQHNVPKFRRHLGLKTHKNIYSLVKEERNLLGGGQTHVNVRPTQRGSQLF